MWVIKTAKPLPTNTKNPPDDDFPLSHLHALTQTPRNKTSIHIVQLLLHLLLSPNFSLCVCLPSCLFQQSRAGSRRNGVGVGDLAHMLDGRTSSSGSSSLSSSIRGNAVCCGTDEMIFKTIQTRREGEAIMACFLRRCWKGCSTPLTMRKWAYFGVQSSDATVSERIHCRPPNSRPVLSIVDRNESAPEFSASANAGGRKVQEMVCFRRG